jgi:predicted dehydrogenase
LVNEGVIGTPLTVNIRLHKASGEKDQYKERQTWHTDPQIAGAGYFYDLGSHQFDYLDFVFGPITYVKGIAHNRAGFYPTEDTVSAAFAFESGVTGTGSWCFVVAKGNEEDVIEITGTKGKIVFSCFEHGNVRLITPQGEVSLSFQNPENISHYLIQQVVNELRGEGKCESTGYSAARASKVLEEIVSGYYKINT